ncbi:Uncharacterised protein [Vibrio cholerae]|uniref:Uncharacterized protein n=1 Tax=Vibrio cholerae TaxID=666 RepID=A0A655WHM3_VIBCL|nr:Uncharacterised protein [Vibrio cholerae]
MAIFNVGSRALQGANMNHRFVATTDIEREREQGLVILTEQDQSKGTFALWAVAELNRKQLVLKQRPALMTINEWKQLSMALFQKCKMFNQPLCALLG